MKPQPKPIKVLPGEYPRTLRIYYASPALASWIRGNCGEFGYLFKPETSDHFSLTVSNLYDLDEVIRYIEGEN